MRFINISGRSCSSLSFWFLTSWWGRLIISLEAGILHRIDREEEPTITDESFLERHHVRRTKTQPKNLCGSTTNTDIKRTKKRWINTYNPPVASCFGIVIFHSFPIVEISANMTSKKWNKVINDLFRLRSRNLRWRLRRRFRIMGNPRSLGGSPVVLDFIKSYLINKVLLTGLVVRIFHNMAFIRFWFIEWTSLLINYQTTNKIYYDCDLNLVKVLFNIWATFYRMRQSLGVTL